MPFVNYPIQCVSCRGLGQVKPAGVFEAYRSYAMTECLNCKGKGTFENMVYVNPVVDVSPKNSEYDKPIKPVYLNPAINENEYKKISKDIKKINFKKEYKDAVR